MKIGNCPFWYNFETFDGEIKIEQEQIPNIYLKKIRIITANNRFKDFFGI